MNASIILVGSALLILIAIVIGVADSRAQRSAWRSIGAERRANWEERRRLTALLSDLTEDAAVCPCRVCSLVRRMFGGGDHRE